MIKVRPSLIKSLKLGSPTPLFTSSQRRSESPLRLTPEQIQTAYRVNAIKTQKDFEGKLVAVTGRIDIMDTDAWGTPYVVLEGGVRKYLTDTEEIAKISKARVRQSITLEGRFIGKDPLAFNRYDLR